MRKGVRNDSAKSVGRKNLWIMIAVLALILIIGIFIYLYYRGVFFSPLVPMPALVSCENARFQDVLSTKLFDSAGAETELQIQAGSPAARCTNAPNINDPEDPNYIPPWSGTFVGSCGGYGPGPASPYDPNQPVPRVKIFVGNDIYGNPIRKIVEARNSFLAPGYYNNVNTRVIQLRCCFGGSICPLLWSGVMTEGTGLDPTGVYDKLPGTNQWSGDFGGYASNVQKIEIGIKYPSSASDFISKAKTGEVVYP